MNLRVLIGLIIIFSVQLSGQTLNARITNVRVDGSNFKWDVQIRRTDDWGSGGGNNVLGNCDFYFYINQNAFTGASPALSGINSALAGSGRYSLRSGRAGSNSQCWIALDYNAFGGGSDWYPPLNSWATVFTAALPISNYNQQSDLYWHTSSTGFLRGNMLPLNDVLYGGGDIVLFVITIDDLALYEGNAGNTPFTFTVRLNQPSASVVNVNYQTANQTATAGSDYTAVPSTLMTFSPGETTRPATVTVFGDMDYEPDETFFVNLSGAVNAVIQDGQATGTIQNEDTFADMDIVTEDGTKIKDRSAYDFGIQLTQTITEAVFTIKNNGTEDLILGTPGKDPVVIIGADHDQFSVRRQPDAIIPPGQTTTFRIQFRPTTPGSKRAAVSIQTNDFFDNPFDIIFIGSSLNPALTISDLPDQILPEDTSTDPIHFTVDHETNGAEGLKVEARSSNQELIPDSCLQVNGTGKNRTLIMTPAPNMSGTAIVTVTVSDSAGTNSDQLTVTVTPVNDPPVISEIGDVTVQQDGTVPPVIFTIQDPETAPDELSVTCSSDNPDLVPEANLMVAIPEEDGASEQRILIVMPAAGESGTAVITVTVSDGEAAADESFALTVTPWPVFQLTTFSTDPSAGIVTPETALYDSSVYVDITAVPAPGYVFSYWSGDAEGSESPLTIIMDRAKTIYAHFMVNDTVAPGLVNIYPPPGSVQVPRNSWIQFKIKEEDAGLNAESLQVVVNGVAVIANGNDQTGGLTEQIVQEDGVCVFYRPTDPLNGDSTVTVSIQCSDLMDPPNIINEEYSFCFHPEILVSRQAIAWVEEKGDTLTDGATGLTLQIPEGALTEPVQITLGSVANLPELPDSVSGLGLALHFGPDGLIFQDSVTIGIPINEVVSFLGEDTDLDALHLIYFHSTSGLWSELPVSYTDSAFVYVRIMEFCYLTGILETHTSPVSGMESKGVMPQILQISQNYPNPFNPITTFEYTLQKQARVKIIIYNMKGQAVAVLKDAVTAAGRYSVTWDASSGESGIYFYHVQTREAVKIGKCLFIK